MGEKVMFYDGLFDEIAKEYTDHKSKRTKIGIVITHGELRALKSRNKDMVHFTIESAEEWKKFLKELPATEGVRDIQKCYADDSGRSYTMSGENQ